MRQPNFFCAMYGVIQNAKDEILLMQRQNTGYMDGCWSLPAGHADDGELPIEACIREMEEEIGITVKKEDISFLHCNAHPAIIFGLEGKMYVSLTFRIAKYTGEIQNKEPKKCADIRFFPLDNLPKELPPEVAEMFKGFPKVPYSENR